MSSNIYQGPLTRHELTVPQRELLDREDVPFQVHKQQCCDDAVGADRVVRVDSVPLHPRGCGDQITELFAHELGQAGEPVLFGDHSNGASFSHYLEN